MIRKRSLDVGERANRLVEGRPSRLEHAALRVKSLSESRPTVRHRLDLLERDADELQDTNQYQRIDIGRPISSMASASAMRAKEA
jgi:hypothetical protein